ncbi:hypothetical protein EDD11_007375 [Mortierella claussenii]|nr:hypothetical protein EDD11_007375 [Mortierella claussenii]
MPPKFSVTIAGGGIGGLTLAIMLQAADIDFVVLERSSALRTLGSTIALNACSLRLMEQLGLWPAIQKMSKPIGAFHLQYDDLSPIGTIDFTFGEKHYGYYGYVMSRPELFELLKSHVPQNKILLRKTVMDVIESDDGVLCRCADGSEYWSDMVVGADGAYSKVRESIYHRLEHQDRLPSKDAEPLKLTHLCVLGVSKPLDPEKFPAVLDGFSQFELTLLRERSLSIWLSPVAGNKISWCYGGELDADHHASAGDLNAFWGKSTIKTQKMLDDIRDIPTVYGCKVGDIISTTPADLVSSVVLEEKFFETWHTQRVVLLGDACHKLLPFAGQGAVHAMLDGLCLVNLLHDMAGTTSDDFHQVFQTYYQQRSRVTRRAVVGSRLFGHFVSSKGYFAQWLRSIALSFLPKWFASSVADLVMRDRPQLSFLPRIEDRGIIKARC